MKIWKKSVLDTKIVDLNLKKLKKSTQKKTNKNKKFISKK